MGAHRVRYRNRARVAMRDKGYWSRGRSLAVGVSMALAFTVGSGVSGAQPKMLSPAQEQGKSPTIDRFVDPAVQIPTRWQPTKKEAAAVAKVKAKDMGGRFVTNVTYNGVRYSGVSYQVGANLLAPKKRALASVGFQVASADTWETLIAQNEAVGWTKTIIKGITYMKLVSTFGDETFVYHNAIRAANGYAAMGSCIYSRTVADKTGRSCAAAAVKATLKRPI
jgi:hypothetical protein